MHVCIYIYIYIYIHIHNIYIYIYIYVYIYIYIYICLPGEEEQLQPAEAGRIPDAEDEDAAYGISRARICSP